MQTTRATIGLVADPQYCPHKADQILGDSARRYKQALPKLVAAVEALTAEPHLDAILQLGDIIDGANFVLQSSTEALAPCLAALAAAGRPVYHVVGNNERRNFTVAQLARGPLGLRPNAAGGGAQCYDRVLATGWRLVVLDSYHLTGLKARRDDGPGDTHAAAAKQMLRQNGLEDALSWPVRESAPHLSPTDLRRRFYEGNGGFGNAQLLWLQDVLEEAQARNERVLVAGHNPVHPLAANDPNALAWDYDKLRELMNRFPCVVAYIAGHDHKGGYALDQQHHITVPALLEVEADEDRYVVLELNEHQMLIRGQGTIEINPGERVLQGDTHSRPRRWIKLERATPHVLKI